MQPSSILESALYVTDLAAAEAFYGDVMGLECIAKVEGRHVFFRCGEGVLLLFNAEATKQPPAADARLPVPPHGTTGQGHLCFAASADEIERWKTELEAKGVIVEADFEWPPKAGEASGGRSIYFRDPAGNSLEFAEPRIWAKN
jgi:catechol 2,3-dioxygenase-like lactoylglutathione lyase family enzyme